MFAPDVGLPHITAAVLAALSVVAVIWQWQLMSVWLVYCGAAFSLFLAYKVVHLHNHFRDALGRVLPGPRAKLLGGNAPHLRRLFLTGDFSGGLRDVSRKYANYGTVGMQVPFSNSLVVLCTPDAIKAVVASNHMRFPKTDRYESMEIALGKGLVTSNGALWKAHRSLINPAFHDANLKLMLPRFALHGNTLACEWEKLLATDPVCTVIDLHNFMGRVTGDIIADVGFGYKMDQIRGKHDPVQMAESVMVLLDEMGQRFQEATRIPRFLPSQRNLRLRAALERIDHVVSPIIRSRRETHARDTDDKPEPGTDLMGIIMMANGQMTEEEHGGVGAHKLTDSEVKDHVLTFMGAGHETTSNGMTWTLFELCRHSHIMARVLQEIDEVLGPYQPKEDPAQPTYGQLGRMTYLMQVIKESLRLHPPVGLIGRQCTEDVVIDGYHFRKGQRFLLNINALHHNPYFWGNLSGSPGLPVGSVQVPVLSDKRRAEIEAAEAEVMAFRPERFDREEEKARHRFSFLPFSAGARHCIGQRFALLEMQVLLSVLLRRFQISLVSMGPVEVTEAVTRRPKGGLMVRISRRQ